MTAGQIVPMWFRGWNHKLSAAYLSESFRLMMLTLTATISSFIRSTIREIPGLTNFGKWNLTARYRTLLVMRFSTQTEWRSPVLAQVWKMIFHIIAVFLYGFLAASGNISPLANTIYICVVIMPCQSSAIHFKHAIYKVIRRQDEIICFH